MPDAQNGDAGRAHVVDDHIGVDRHQFPRTVLPKAVSVWNFGEAFGRASEAKRHASGRCGIEVADEGADRDQIGNGGRNEDCLHDGAGRSSAVPQLSSQSATSRRGVVCPAATCARASAIARVSASSSVGSKAVAGSAMRYPPWVAGKLRCLSEENWPISW